MLPRSALPVYERQREEDGGRVLPREDETGRRKRASSGAKLAARTERNGARRVPRAPWRSAEEGPRPDCVSLSMALIVAPNHIIVGPQASKDQGQWRGS